MLPSLFLALLLFLCNHSPRAGANLPASPGPLAALTAPPQRCQRRDRLDVPCACLANAFRRIPTFQPGRRPSRNMADDRPAVSEEGSEEKTEPFSSQIEAAYGGLGIYDAGAPLHKELVPLDILHVDEGHFQEGVRLLVRPLTGLPNGRSVSPGSDNCRWLALRAEVASAGQPEHKVLAVTQTSRDIKFSVRIPEGTEEDFSRPPLWCELYYDPASDQVIFVNKSDVPLSIDKVSQEALDSPRGSESHFVEPGLVKALRPGTWRLAVGYTAVLDFRILEKRPVTVYQAPPALPEDAQSSSVDASNDMRTGSKRPLGHLGGELRVKRRSSDVKAGDDGLVMFLNPSTEPFVFSLPGAGKSRELSAVNSQALIDAREGETVVVPAVCDLEEYRLTKRQRIASTALSTVYRASHSHVPDKILTVKVLKTRTAQSIDRPQVQERNIIRQADMWQRESRNQEGLVHKSIVGYYGGDARHLSLYMEHIDAPDLASERRWRSRADHMFQGSEDDARRILFDIASALEYLHRRQMLHNDIKPANILYSPERGAVLCDFGLSTLATNPSSGGGTPYYVPPEYIGDEIRGPPSDVWALGVTMLYVLRKIPWPDGRGMRHHPKPLYWRIAGVNKPKLPFRHIGNGQPAAEQMRQWLSEVYESREKLSVGDCEERLVKEMLAPQPTQRILTETILRELASDRNPSTR